MTTPTLINLPPPPSNPDTPSDMGPGTPNSGTTSLSALSTTAIKDGHRGHQSAHVVPYGASQSLSAVASTNTLEAERADRISRLAGLERVTAARSSTGTTTANPRTSQPPGYFDGSNPQIKERSTVGSASATGSVGGRTAWTSSSEINETDKMSEDHDDALSSTGAPSEEGDASLVGFGEGASSTISGPTSTAGRAPSRPSEMSSPSTSRGSARPMLGQSQDLAESDAPSSSVASTPTAAASPADVRRDPQPIDGTTYDADIDIVNRTPIRRVGLDENPSTLSIADSVIGGQGN